ncbi:structural maintenance of chromosomes protein 6-like [Hetaerina americana]|uniref:structural maintenance of chromosomes protein 6-like n=1 Tax=Hetaerina americana TaxID=62018 RepID=UPI003A7F1C0C
MAIKGNNGSFIICLDSLSTLKSMLVFSPMHVIVQEIHHTLQRKGDGVSFIWTPGDVGIPGNEKADKVAKEALGKLETDSTLKNPREEVEVTCLRMGHSALTHLYFFMEEKALSPCNDCALMAKHIVAQCNKYQRARESFKTRGEPGSFLKVKDKSWAPAVESVIGGDNLRSYIVNDHQDRKVLYNLIKKVTRGGGPVPSVVATKFMDKIYDYESHSVNCPGYSNVLNMLEVSDHIVANSLMDLLSIETTLLVDDPRAAREMMMHERNVPKNCKKVVTKSGDTYYPDPNYRCYSGDDRTQAKFLQVSVEDAKREMLAEITSVKKWAENTLSQKCVVGKRIQLHKGEIQAAKKVLDQLSNKKLSLKQQIMDLQRSDPVDANQINFWVEEKNTLKAELENLEILSEQSKSDYKDIEDSYKNMVDQYNALKEESKSKSREIDSMVSKSHQLDNKLMKAKSLLDGATKRKQECLKLLRKVEHQVAEQKKLVEAATEGALKLSKERIETERSVAEITEEIKEFKNEIERVEQIEGNPKELGERYSAYKIKCDGLANEISVLDHCARKLKSMLSHRRIVYSKCLQLLVTRMQILFQSLIDRRRFQGGIEIDHSERKLDIKVTLRNPSPGKAKCGAKRAADTGDPKSLSGGERSFATVAFILSMWEALELPFYALDEFDVYMDNANREITLDLLITHGLDKKDYQFVFLTPQPINPSLQSDEIHIFNLECHEAQKRAMSQ